MRYSVKAVKTGGAVISLSLDARDDRDANEQAQAQGYIVLGVRRAGSIGLPSGGGLGSGVYSTLSRSVVARAVLEGGESVAEWLLMLYFT